MAAKKSGATASSGTKQKVAEVSSVGRPNQTVAAIREQYKQEQERQIANFKKAQDALRQFKDPTKNSATNISPYTRETIRQYLQNVSSYSSQLQAASKYYYYRSQVYFRLINWYANMWDLRCRKVIPEYDLVKGADINKTLKSYNETLTWLDHYSLQENIIEVLINCYLYDVCYAVFFRSENGSFFYILPYDECQIIGRYDTGDLAYAIDASKWRSTQRRQLAEWLGSPFSDIIAEYDRSGTRWIEMPAEYAACFKFRIEDLNNIIVPFSSLLQSLAGLTDTEDVQAILDDQSIYRLIAVPMKVLSGARESDSFEISPDLLLDYYAKFQDILPDYVSAAPIPGELTNDNVIDFSTTAADKDIDRLSTSQDTLLSIAGGGAVLNANKITSTAAFNAFLKAESELAISSLIGQIQAFTNRILKYDCSNPCRVEYFEVTVYTKQELIENLLKMNQHSFSDRLVLQACLGFSEKTTLAMEFLENQVLGLPEMMNHPLMSSYTTSGASGEVGQGRDKIPDDQLEPSSDRSRNA